MTQQSHNHQQGIECSGVGTGPEGGSYGGHRTEGASGLPKNTGTVYTCTCTQYCLIMRMYNSIMKIKSIHYMYVSGLCKKLIDYDLKVAYMWT